MGSEDGAGVSADGGDGVTCARVEKPVKVVGESRRREESGMRGGRSAEVLRRGVVCARDDMLRAPGMGLEV